MDKKGLLLAKVVVSASLFAVAAFSSDARQDGGNRNKYFREAVQLYDSGDYSAASLAFEKLKSGYAESQEYAAYGIMCSLQLRTEGAYEAAVSFLRTCPQSVYRTRMTYLMARTDFEAGRYARCLEISESVKLSQLDRKEREGWHFYVGYSCFMEGYWERARQMLESIAGSRSGFRAPSCYVMGYMAYVDRRFSEAAGYFEKSSSDSRFGTLSLYYLAECRYMMEDYAEVTSMAEKGLVPGTLEGDYRKSVMRIISESYMAQGRTEDAGKYYEGFFMSSDSFTRSDYFHAGMVAYGLKNYKDAVSHLSQVASEADSIAQVAAYYCGYSYVQTGNKLAALDYFRKASSASYDSKITEDACFNYAKLAYDVNGDMSGFSDYISKYPSSDKTDEIYGYMASASLIRRDYASAIDAYRKMIVLNSAARDNFRAALFLRSMQLAGSGAYSSTVPLLKQVTRLKSGDKLGFLADYWLAEAYYRMEKYGDALEISKELYRQRSFSDLPEYKMLQYNIGYDYFKMGDYQNASSSFVSYLSGSPSFRKEAMLRDADCRFMLKNYREAAEIYEKCADGFYDKGDIYPLYKGAVAYGLVGMEPKKISMLERVLDYPVTVPMYENAVFELGRSYVKIDDDVRAEGIFRNLLENTADSTLVASSVLELGSIYRNRTEYGRALECYKRIVEQMPSSREAQDALAAIESIYQTQGKPREYLDYIESIGKASIKSEDEKESMFFSAAEQLFLKGDYSSALVSLNDFLKRYPEGHNVSQAYFYVAEANRNLGRQEKALDAYYKVMVLGDDSFAESATLNYAEISYKLQRYQQAYEGYATLGEIARFENSRYISLTGIMRSKYMLKEYDNAIIAASDLLASPACDEPASREAMFIQAKSYIALSDREKASPILKSLSEFPQTPEGAEATYILIQEMYDSGRFDEVEDAVYSFSEKAPEQVYFLAKSFIVLGDSFAERDEWEQARATFESIRDNYKAPQGGDDILDQVEMRLKRMREIGLD